MKIELKQHTPLIHFQPNENGATLRASEVKPRLDRFIIEKEGNGEYEQVKKTVKEQHESWFISKDEVYALNYKMIIEAEAQIPISIKPKNETCRSRNYPLVLSNMATKPDRDDIADFSFYSRITLTFIVDNKGLADKIKNYIVSFFDNNNFGQRNNKGFGSFSVISINGEKISENNPYEGIPYISYSFNGIADKKEYKTLFTIIDYYWKRLKSGINYTTRSVNQDNESITREGKTLYHKSYLYYYLKNKKINNGNTEKYLTWEKRKIKTELGLESARLAGDPTPSSVPSNSVCFFARAHLGCPTGNIMYRIAKGKLHKSYNPQKQKNEKIEDTEKAIIKISNNKGIERIPSPIIFKPIITSEGNTTTVNIYLLVNETVINSLTQLQDNPPMFTFRYGHNTTRVGLFPDNNKFIFDYYDLINSFHKSCDYTLSVFDGHKQQININIELSKN